MCRHEIIGDFYRGCQHFHGRYFTGETWDCGLPNCKSSIAHKHSKSKSDCRCEKVVIEERRIENMFQIPYPLCPGITR